MLALATFLLAVMSMGTRLLRSWVVLGASMSWRVSSSTNVFRYMLKLPLAYFDKVQRGELISRVTNDIDNITQTMQQSLSSVVTSVLTVIGVLIMMFSISWQLALVALISLPLMAVIFGVIGPRSQKAFGTQWRKVVVKSNP